MRVISKSRLSEFWESPGCGDAEGPLRAWYQHVNHRSVAWSASADVKEAFGSASAVGNCTVFNIGDKFRLVVRILYASQKVFVLKCMTHAEYDRDLWKADCGCFAAPSGKSDSRRNLAGELRKKRKK